MGHGHRAAAADLLVEQRGNATATPQHVPESHGREYLTVLGPCRNRADDLLREGLRDPQHGDRIHCFVCRDVHEAPHAGRESSFGDDPGASEIVQDRFVWILFE
jgi:hypothetical protein